MKTKLIPQLEGLLDKLLETKEGLECLKSLAVRNNMYEKGALIRDYQLKNFPDEKPKPKDDSERRYFAAMAMQGMLHTGAMTQDGKITQHPDVIAELAVNQADALINALNKQEGGEG